MNKPSAVATLTLVSMMAACASHHPGHAGAGSSSATASAGSAGAAGARMVPAATDEQQKALLGKVKMLEGKWSMQGKDGVALEFAVTANGSAVREIMFPGSSHEMTNLYHMDGSTMVMTHYCAAGNQPRMRAAKAHGNRIDMAFDSVTNLNAADEDCMKEMSLEFIDKDHFKEHWKSWKGEKQSEESVFAFARVK